MDMTDMTPLISKACARTTDVLAAVTDEQLDVFYQLSYQTLPSHRLVRIPDAAHFIMFDNPTRFFAEVDAFLSPE